ncbi:hypothetical protein O3M35_007728 [Rhynocoris fuscipes]|uniref:Uncharacterized protein n=1 Tax=Rhynocoris fuscipes TaxID=488301 RepID=A0AAW1DAK4_9HEMI
MRTTSINILIFASAAASVSGYPMLSSSKRYGAWLPFIAHPPPYIETLNAPTQDELFDVYYPPAEPPLYYHTSILPYYYSVPEYQYETPIDEQEDEPEQWYVDNNAEVNALFLRNLMLAQLYNQAMQRDDNIGDERIWPKTRADDDEFQDDDSETYIYGEPMKAVSPLSKEDRDVRELKSLVENRWVDKRDDEKKIITSRNQIRQEHKPSAYDAIKKLLIQQEKKDTDSRQPHKRSYTPNEDSLVEQLGNLKKI